MFCTVFACLNLSFCNGFADVATTRAENEKFEALEVVVKIQGDGPGAAKGDTVFAEYTGSLASTGVVFDTNVGKNKPFQFEIGKGSVIQGWEKGFVGLGVGTEAQPDTQRARLCGRWCTWAYSAAFGFGF